MDVVVCADAFVVDNGGKALQCEPPLMRVRNSASLHIKIKEDWHPQHPWDQIILEGGQPVIIHVVLIADDGRQYLPSIIGSAANRDGKFVGFRFNPQIPQKAIIRSIILKANFPISVETVKWHNFDPI